MAKTDIWMPVFIGDYLADTMHLSTEQHGAYLLLLFHLWRRGSLRDDDALLAKISGLGEHAWSIHRAVLAEFFEIRDGLWQHGRVERERTRIAAKNEANAKKAKLAASSRWSNGNASSIAQALLDDADSDSYSDSDSKPLKPSGVRFSHLSQKARDMAHPRLLDTPKQVTDSRHGPFRAILGQYWQAKNLASPEMPWQGRDGKALSDFLAASPNLSEKQFRQMLGNRARSAVAHGDRVYLWIGNLTRFQEEITVYNKPASAGGGNASRAEINRNSVVSAVDRALELAREHAHRTGQAGPEQTAFDDAGMSLADGAGPDGCALAVPGNGDYRMAAGDPAHGQAGTDGPLPYRAATTAAGGAYRIGGQEVSAR